MIADCKYCGDNSVYSIAKVSGKAECYYDNVGEMAAEQETDHLNWQHLKTVYCVRCGRKRTDLAIQRGLLLAK